MSLISCDCLWRENAVRFFGLHKRTDALRIDPGADVSQEAKTAANRLVNILRCRFKILLKQRIRQKSRRDHWSMKFAFKNLLVVAYSDDIVIYAREDKDT